MASVGKALHKETSKDNKLCNARYGNGISPGYEPEDR